MTKPYCYVCAACEHPSHVHGLVEGGDLREGPYRCRDCGCEIAQNAPTLSWSASQFESYLASVAGEAHTPQSLTNKGIDALPPDVRAAVLKARAENRARPYKPPNKEALREMVRWSEENGFYDEPPESAGEAHTQ